MTVASPGAPTRDERVRGRWLVFLATVSWGTSATLARAMFRDDGVSPVVAVELRLLTAVALLLAWMGLRQRDALRVERADLGYLLVLGTLGVAAVQVTYYHAIATLGVGPAILLQYLAPSLIVAWDMLRGRKPRMSLVIAVGLALVGTTAIVSGMERGTMTARPLDWAIGIASAVVFAFYIVYSKRGLAKYRPETILFHTFSIAAIVYLVAVPQGRVLEELSRPNTWWRFALLGLFSTLVPFRAFYSGLRRLSPAEAGVIATAEPVIAILAAAAFLGETLGPIQTLGAALVLVAALLASREHDENTPAVAERA